jgi:hypothetical protein
MLRGILFLLCSLSLVFAAMSLAVSAAGSSPTDEKIELFQTMIKDLASVMCDLARVVTAVVGVIAVTLIVLAGAQYVFSADNPQEREEAKERVIQIIIGLAIVIIVKVFVDWIADRMHVTGYCT